MWNSNMVTIQEARSWALDLPEAVEAPHFEKTSFRVKKKIFATIDIPKQIVVVKLSEIEQSVFCDPKHSVIYPVSGAWGKQGWTMIALKKVRKTMFKDALKTSYQNVAPKSLSGKL